MTPSEPLILPFAEIRADNLPLVGGKGANLGEMAHAGFPIPPGFCLTTTAFRRFLAAGPDPEGLYALLDAIPPDDVDSVRRIGQQVRQTLRTVPVPKEIVEAVRRAWQEIGAEHAYAVRSSATAEDLPDASFAGQQDTFLNVRGEAALLDAIRRCWISLFTDRAILYRCQNGFPHREVLLSVVVQQMVMAEKSGILFTADPLTGHRHTLVLNASFGLGEALVGGLVSPDTYRVDKRSRTLLDRQIADKQIAVFPMPDGGTRQKTLPSELRRQPALNDEQILTLTDLGCRIEAHYGTPQDIEWAIASPIPAGEGTEEERRAFYILQARPITSLYPIDGLVSPDDSLHVYFSMGHQQNMTRAMSPLSLSSIQMLLPLGRDMDRFDNVYVRASGGRLFLDITTLLRHPLLRKVVFTLTAQFDVLAPEMLRAVMQRPEFQRPHNLRPSFTMLRFLVGFFIKTQHALWRQNLTGFTAQTNARIDRFLRETARHLQNQPAGKAQIRAVLETLFTIFPFFMNWIPQFAAGEIAKRIVPRLGRRVADPATLEKLSLGLPGNVVTEMNLAIGDLADLARQAPRLVDWFDQLGDDGHAWLEQAAQREGSAPFLEGWNEFIARYGARGPAEIDIMQPRWYEDPLPVLQVIASHLKQEPGSHRMQHQRLVQARQAAAARLLEAAGRGPLGRVRVRLFNRLLHVITEVGGLREHHKFVAVRFLQTVKEILKTNAALLVAGGKLAHPDDLWFLSWGELLTIWDDERTDWTAVAAQRRAALERYQKLMPPLVITSDGETPTAHYHIDDAPPGALLGNPVSAGVVEGVVRVIHNPQRETLNPGEILVAEFTDPGWTPLFINAGGLVMEVGGALNHGSVVAREYSIPAVVGVRDATRKLRTGQRVRVDGNRGIVEILESNGPQSPSPSSSSLIVP